MYLSRYILVGEILRLLGPFGLGCVLFYLYVMWESPLIVVPFGGPLCPLCPF